MKRGGETRQGAQVQGLTLLDMTASAPRQSETGTRNNSEPWRGKPADISNMRVSELYQWQSTSHIHGGMCVQKKEGVDAFMLYDCTIAPKLLQYPKNEACGVSCRDFEHQGSPILQDGEWHAGYSPI